MDPAPFCWQNQVITNSNWSPTKKRADSPLFSVTQWSFTLLKQCLVPRLMFNQFFLFLLSLFYNNIINYISRQSQLKIKYFFNKMQLQKASSHRAFPPAPLQLQLGGTGRWPHHQHLPLDYLNVKQKLFEKIFKKDLKSGL